MREISLSNGNRVDFDENNLDPLMDTIVKEILNPFYESCNDWNLTIKKGLEEIESIIKSTDLSRNTFVDKLFAAIERNLQTTIEKLTGVDKVEILFLNIDDYVNDILESVKKAKSGSSSQEELRNEINEVIRHLNIFEMGEITIYLAKKVLGFKDF